MAAYRTLRQTEDSDSEGQAELRAQLAAVQMTVAGLTGAQGFYRVQPLDSLSGIATFFYRNGARWPEILEANAYLLDDPNTLFPGMTLVIP